MLKNNRPVIVALILFLLLNTYYFWTGLLGSWNMLILSLFAVSFIYLLIAIVYHLVISIKERGENKLRIYMLISTIVFTTLIFWRPEGLINFEQFESKNLLVAEYDGGSAYGETLKLKENNKYTMQRSDFGVDKVSGIYSIQDSVITFKTTSFNQSIPMAFGIIRPGTHDAGNGKYEIWLYQSKKDTLAYQFVVTKNSLLGNVKSK